VQRTAPPRLSRDRGRALIPTHQERLRTIIDPTVDLPTTALLTPGALDLIGLACWACNRRYAEGFEAGVDYANRVAALHDEVQRIVRESEARSAESEARFAQWKVEREEWNAERDAIAERVA
jgi:hypothetical protein